MKKTKWIVAILYFFLTNMFEKYSKKCILFILIVLKYKLLIKKSIISV